MRVGCGGFLLDMIMCMGTMTILAIRKESELSLTIVGTCALSLLIKALLAVVDSCLAYIIVDLGFGVWIKIWEFCYRKLIV